jgi:lipoate-protein ligase B
MIDSKFLGRQEYKKTWELQRSLADKRLNGLIPDTLLFVEHDPVFTIGRSGSENNILFNSDDTSEKIPVVHIDRGGDITFHGPGQLVGYPVIKLADYYTDLHRYLRDLEEVIIRTLAEYGIASERRDGLTGVWTGGKKVASIGVKVTRWITYHGFALNVNTDLSYFEMINPCGIADCVTTSIKELTGTIHNLDDVAQVAGSYFLEVFISKQKTARISL